MNVKALQQKLEEEASDSPVSLRDVPQYFKDYMIDEVIIVLPQAIRSNPEEESSAGNDNVFDGPARTRELNLANEGEPDKMVFIGDHLTKEESEKLRQLLKEYRDCFAWSYHDLREYLKRLLFILSLLELMQSQSLRCLIELIPKLLRLYKKN